MGDNYFGVLKENSFCFTDQIQMLKCDLQRTEDEMLNLNRHSDVSKY